MTPSTIDTPIHKNREPYYSLDGINCRSISSASITDIQGTPTNNITESNPSNPIRLTQFNSYYTFEINSIYEGIISVTSSTSAKFQSFTNIIDAILQPPTFVQQFVAF